MRKTIALLALAAIAATPASPVTALAGRYIREHRISILEGIDKWVPHMADDVVDIVPVDSTHAFIDVELAFENGHDCTVSGIAGVSGKTLVYAPRPGPGDPGPACRLTIAARGNKLLLDDGDGSCRLYCGARGSLSGFDSIPLAAKRRVPHIAKIKASPDYRSAIEDWKAGKVE